MKTNSLFHQLKFLCRATNDPTLDKVFCPKELLPPSGEVTLISRTGARGAVFLLGKKLNTASGEEKHSRQHYLVLSTQPAQSNCFKGVF